MKLAITAHMKNVHRASTEAAMAHGNLATPVTNHAERHTAALDAKRKSAEIEARVNAGISAINNKV